MSAGPAVSKERPRRMRAWRALGAAVLAIAGAQAAAAGLALRDDRGRTIELAHAPQRLVALLPSLTESVCALQACDRLVGVDRYSNWPATVAALPHLGGQDDAQVERILALKPDLVLAGTEARVVDRLEALGIPVLALESRQLADVRRVLETLAQALGRAGAGTAAWQRIEAQVAHAAAGVPAGWRGRRAYFEVAADPYAAGASSFIGELLARLGLANIVPPALGPFPKLNPEFVLRAQPDLILAQDRNLDEMPGRPGWRSLQALQAGRSCGFAPAQYDVLVRPGPRLGEAAELMAACIAGLAPPRP
jgi:iron complex transport system substrate-binding protein